MERKLKVVILIAVIVLIAIISFVGVYSKDGVIFNNNLPEYVLSSELGNKRISKLAIKDDTNEVIYDKDGNKVDAIPEGAKEEEYNKVQEKVNKDEVLNTDNYKKVREILNGRLEGLGIEDYLVRVDETNGNVIVELKEELSTDRVLQYLLSKGDFEITDTDDGTVLLDKSHVKDAKVVYGNGTSSGVNVYLDIIFNDEGKAKLAEISRTYVKVEENKDKQENTDENKNDENAENSENKDEDKDEDKDKQKTVTLTLEGTEMMSTYFGEEMKNGELPISLGSASDSDTLREYADQGEYYAMLLNNDTMPIEYEMGLTTTVSGSESGERLTIVIAVILIISLIIFALFIYKFKLDGVVFGLSMVAALAILLLEIRYTMVEISLNAIMTIGILIILNSYIVYKMLNSIKNNNDYEYVRKVTVRTYIDQIGVIFVTLFLAIVFTFMQYTKVFSIGMTLFYGVISIAIANFAFLRPLLLIKYNKEN